MSKKYYQASNQQNHINCNNCGKDGHVYNQCKISITSIGFVAFRRVPHTKNEIEYLMICRKNTLGYIDFMRGKYMVDNRSYIMKMFEQMTLEEKQMLATNTFDAIWANLWGFSSQVPSKHNHNSEEWASREKFQQLKETGQLQSMIDESRQKHPVWTEAEWGFPKGRRNHFQETDLECAYREFCEETGYAVSDLFPLTNLFPFEENFIGSNNKSYKHKYFVAMIPYDVSCRWNGIFQYDEVAKLEWCSLETCLQHIRSYNVEKKQMLLHIHACFTNTKMGSVW